MNLSEEEIQDERDDGAPIEVLEQYFEARGWACERTAEGEIVASAMASACSKLRPSPSPTSVAWRKTMRPLLDHSSKWPSHNCSLIRPSAS